MFLPFQPVFALAVEEQQIHAFALKRFRKLSKNSKRCDFEPFIFFLISLVQTV